MWGAPLPSSPNDTRVGGRPECPSEAGWGRGGPDGPDGPHRVSDGWELHWASSNSRPAGVAAGVAEGVGGEKLVLGRIRGLRGTKEVLALFGCLQPQTDLYLLFLPLTWQVLFL